MAENTLRKPNPIRFIRHLLCPLTRSGQADSSFAQDNEPHRCQAAIDIHLELIAWQFDIEKMRKAVLPKTRNDLFREIKKLPEYKNKTQCWFNDVLKDIKLTGWKKGHPYQFSAP
jgi:hypothetical protein